MKMVTKTGLVPVHSFKTGQVFGVKPGIALAMLAAKECELVDIPEGIPTTTVPDLPAPKKIAAPAETVLIAIPAGWEKMHFLQQIKLAKSLVEDFVPPEGMKPLEFAKKIIGEELQRRAAAGAASE